MPNLNADKLDGLDSSGFIQGEGRIIAIETGQLAPDTGTVFDIPGFIEVDHFCGGPSETGQYNYTTGPDFDVIEFTDNGDGNPRPDRLSANSSYGSSVWATDPAGDAFTSSFEAPGRVATAHVFSWTWTNPFLHQGGFSLQGYVVVNGA